MLKFYSKQVVFQEVPNEISISFSIAGCPLKCPGCSWKTAVSSMLEKQLTDEYYYKALEEYKNLASCVLFYGGEWDKQDLIHKLQIAKSMNYKTCLYTGLTFEKVDKEIIDNLDYIKVGPYIAALGGLDSPKTNQKLINLKTNEIMNHYMIHNAI
jgi:anaerobic ribonucleoside-triphosphate reductase activating protein